MGKISRNEQCPCGSKKKFKNCCLPKGSRVAPIEFDVEWQELRIMEGKISEGAEKFALEEGGEELFEDGLEVFLLDEKSDLSPEEEDFFLDWFIYCWTPSDFSGKWKKFGANSTLAESYVKQENNRKYIDFVDAVSKSPYSFFLIDDVIPSRRVIVKDLLLKNTVVVKERSAAKEEFKGLMILAKVVHYNDQVIFKGVAPSGFPARYAMDILDLRENLSQALQEENINASFLIEHEHHLRDTYFNFEESLHQRPKLLTTEGDPIIFCMICYQIQCSPQKCFDVMSSLCLLQEKQELLQESVFDNNGELYSSEFSWIKEGKSDSILGEIKIKGNKLAIQTNSIPRAEAIKKEVAKRLPEAIFIKMDTEKIEDVGLKGLSGNIEVASDFKDENLHAYYSDYYSKWVDMPVGFLCNETPRQAVKTSTGREKIELFLVELEAEKKQHSYAKQIRKELGLNKKKIEIS